MRTDPARPRAALDRLRAPIETLRARLVGLGPRARWLAASALVAALLAAGYHFAAAEPVGYQWLNPEKPFAQAEADRVLATLREAGIVGQDQNGRISVPADRRVEALAVVARAKLGPRQLDAIRDEYAEAGSFFDDPESKRERKLRGEEQYIQELIARMPGIQGANVALTPVAGGTRLRPVTRMRALVFVRAEGGQLLPDRTVEMILTILGGKDIAREDVTLLDLWERHEYWVGGQPEVAARSSAKAREEELRDRIAKASHIEGVEVLVRIEPQAAPPLPLPSPPKSEPIAPALVVNQPIGEVDASSSASTPTAIESDAATAAPTRVSVWVWVPRNYYQRLARELDPTRTPSLEDLQRLAARSDEQVRQAVNAVLEPGELPEIRIGRFDELAADPPAPSVEPDARRALLAWLPAAVGGGLAVAAALLGLLAVRRPSAKAARAPRRDAFEAGDLGGPGHRVRTLIRRDPAAAAGVLHRWIAQGGRST